MFTLTRYNEVKVSKVDLGDFLGRGAELMLRNNLSTSS